MTIKKSIARKTYALRKRMRIMIAVKKDDECEGVSLQDFYRKKLRRTCKVDLFLRNGGEAVGAITSFDNFHIGGWLNAAYLNTKEVSIVCGPHIVECQLVQDTSKLKHNSSKKGLNIEYFRLTLPGYIWSSHKYNKPLPIRAKRADKSLHENPFYLTTELFQKWLTNIQKVRNQYFSLVAIEHLIYFQQPELLKKGTINYYQSLAQDLNIDIELSNNSHLKQDHRIQMANETAQACHKASKSLNASINAGNAVNMQEFARHAQLYDLSGDTEAKYYSYLVPFICRNNLFEDFYASSKSAGVKSYITKHRSNTNQSMQLAFLAMEESPNELSKSLFNLADNCAREGWIHTECIAFACQHTAKLYEKGTISADDHAEIVYACLALVNAFSEASNPRIFDNMIIEVIVNYLSMLQNFPFWLQQDLSKAALRHYGLSPYFWGVVENDANAPVWNDPHFRKSHGHWTVISNVTDNITYELDDIADSLLFFADNNCDDAILIMRSLAIKSIYLDASADSGLHEPVRRLIHHHALENLRFATHPQLDKHTLINHRSYSLIWEQIRRGSNNAGLSYYLQKEASSCLDRIVSTITDDHAECAEADCQNLANLCKKLKGSHSGYLGLDLLAFAHSQLSSIDPGCSVAGYFETQIEDAYRNLGKFDDQLPAAVDSSLARISHADLLDDVGANDFIDKLQEKSCLKNESFQKSKVSSCKTATQALLFGDTVVVIYSCRKYLDTRVRAIRDTWLKDIQRQDIPYLILVGDGDNELQDDILALDCADTYENLPQKSLKLYEWLVTNTDAQYVLKIDDDCFLNVDEYFLSLSYRKHHYYGRPLYRSHATMDRAWHQGKSSDEHARWSLDKSPTPSVYADGGSSYCLSRIAMLKLLEAAKTMRGQYLIHSSYMEDKLIGDLLALSGIYPSDEDFSIFIRRRTFADAVPVGMWANTFYPTKATPVKIAHLDTEKDMTMVHASITQNLYSPKKIWPAYQAPSLSEQSNQLELLSPIEQAETLLERGLFVVSVIRNEMTMLVHFLEHYRSMGVKTFIIVDNLSDDGSREFLLGQPDVLLYSADTDYKNSNYGVVWQEAVLANHCLNKWVLLADADEFLVFPNMESADLSDFIHKIEKEGADGVKIGMVDMYPRGDLSAADFTMSTPFESASYFDRHPSYHYHFSQGIFSNHTSSVSSLRHRLDPTADPCSFTSQKYALIKYKPWMKFSAGLHDACGLNVAGEPVYFAHFKYHAGFKKKASIEVARAQHYNSAAEYKRYLAMTAETAGDFYDAGVSLKYVNSDSFFITPKTQCEQSP